MNKVENNNNNLINIISSIGILILGLLLFIKKKDFISIIITILGITSILNHTNNNDDDWWIYDLNYKSQIPINNQFIIRLLDYWSIIALILLLFIKYSYKLFFWIIFLIIFTLFLIPRILNLKREKYIITHNLIHIIAFLSIAYLELN